MTPFIVLTLEEKRKNGLHVSCLYTCLYIPLLCSPFLQQDDTVILFSACHPLLTIFTVELFSAV